MASDPDPIREQLAEARRNQILDAAAGVFAEKGFHRATTREIAAQAGVSEGTIYNYFASKADLLISMITRLANVTNLPAELTGALHGDAKVFLEAVFRERAQRIEASHQVLQAVLPEILINPELRPVFYRQFVEPIATVLEQYVQARVEMGDVRPVNIPLAVRVVQSMFIGLLVLRIMGDEVVLSGWKEIPDVVPTVIFDGLKPRDGE
jgi:AcrR family transcriptional regulator